ncbi:MAG: tetratricopeptide repeat protein [Acetobacteraceae bacterium]
MPASKRLLLIAALALCAGQTVARTSQPAAPQASYSADGLYNLANSYARAGKLGLAVLSYERAALLAPDDPDINANLAYVRASAHAPATPQRWFARLVQVMSPALAAWLGVAGIMLAGTGLVAMRITSRSRWLCRAAITLGMLQISLTAFHALLLWPRTQEAVVLVDRTAAHVAPASMADTAFVLREAQSVRMMGKYGNFILVRTTGGHSGWVARADIAAVVPPAGPVLEAHHAYRSP